MQLPLYRPKGNKTPFGILPWSACVVVQTVSGPVLYYEGGAFTRKPEVLPSINELEEYAKIAAGRASRNYPTVARHAIRQSEIDSNFIQIGFVTVESTGVAVRFI